VSQTTIEVFILDRYLVLARVLTLPFDVQYYVLRSEDLVILPLGVKAYVFDNRKLPFFSGLTKSAIEIFILFLFSKLYFAHSSVQLGVIKVGKGEKEQIAKVH
jgi:hypothetical protein